MSSSAVLDFTEPETLQSSLRGAKAKITVTDVGAFKSTLTRIDLPRLWLQQSRMSLPFIAHTANTTTR